MEHKICKKGEVIIRQGQPGDSMYNILWGRVAVYSGYGTPREQKLAELGANDFFGEMELLDKAEMKTVPLMIAQLRSADYSKFDLGKVYMFILLAILPVIVVYIILSKSIIKGVTDGSIKG